jgi:hypothetical protein
MTSSPRWALESGGANESFAVYMARINLGEVGQFPQMPVPTGNWRAAMLVVTKETAWTTAVVELKWQPAPTTPLYSFDPQLTIGSASSPPSTALVDVVTYPFLNAAITTGEGSDAFAEFRLCLFKWR